MLHESFPYRNVRSPNTFHENFRRWVVNLSMLRIYWSAYYAGEDKKPLCYALARGASWHQVTKHLA